MVPASEPRRHREGPSPRAGDRSTVRWCGAEGICWRNRLRAVIFDVLGVLEVHAPRRGRCSARGRIVTSSSSKLRNCLFIVLFEFISWRQPVVAACARRWSPSARPDRKTALAWVICPRRTHAVWGLAGSAPWSAHGMSTRRTRRPPTGRAAARGRRHRRSLSTRRTPVRRLHWSAGSANVLQIYFDSMLRSHVPELLPSLFCSGGLLACLLVTVFLQLSRHDSALTSARWWRLLVHGELSKRRCGRSLLYSARCCGAEICWAAVSRGRGAGRALAPAWGGCSLTRRASGPAAPRARILLSTLGGGACRPSAGAVRHDYCDVDLAGAEELALSPRRADGRFRCGSGGREPVRSIGGPA